MAIQTMGLDYGWLVNLAEMISRNRQQPSGTQATPRPAQGTAAPEKTQYQLDKEQRREDLLSGQTREHEILLKQMEVDSKLAEAMSKERIAGVETEAGTEQTQIAGAAQVASSQKTTMEKGYELMDMLWSMDKPSRDEFISRLEAKRAENQAVQTDRPVSTISSGGTTIPITSAPRAPVGDPNDPLTALEKIGVYNSETGLSEPKPTGAAAKPEIDQYMELLDDMLTKNPQSMIALTSGKGWDELKENMRTIGEEAGFGEDTINSGIAIFEALIPEPKPEPEPGPFTKAWGGVKEAVTPTSPLNVALEKELGVTKTMSEYPGIPFGEARATEKGEAGPAFEALAKGIGPEFGASLADFMTRIITGPFYEMSKKDSPYTGAKVTPSPKPAGEEVGEITKQDFRSQISEWPKEQTKQLEAAAKAEGLTAWEYYKKHKEEFTNE